MTDPFMPAYFFAEDLMDVRTRGEARGEDAKTICRALALMVIRRDTDIRIRTLKEAWGKE